MHSLEIILGFVGTVLTVFGTTLLNRHYQKRDKRKPHTLEKYVNNRSKLQDIVDDLLLNMKAQRADIWLFHNGGYFYNGEPNQKISMVIEGCEKDFEPVIDKMQDLPIQIFIRHLELLKDNKWITEINELQYNDRLALINKLYNVVSSVLYKIVDKNGLWCGFLSLGYDTHKHISESDIALIEDQIPSIIKHLIYAFNEAD